MHDGNHSSFPQVKSFLKHHYRHFNSAVLVDAAEAYADHVRSGGKMMLAMAGAMSTAELGISLAAMIRGGKVHAVSCTGPTWKRTFSTWSPMINTGGCPITGS